MILLQLAALVCVLQGPGRFSSGGIVITNFNPGIVEGLGTGSIERHVKLTGDPVSLSAPARGFNAKANELEFTWAELDPKTTELRKGRMQGSAMVRFDSEVAAKAVAEEAAKKNVTPPVPKTESNQMQVNSEQLLYEGTTERGKLTMPVPWIYKGVTKGTQIQTKEGKPINVAFDQTFDTTGSKGQFDIVKGPDGNLGKLEKGTMDGPVTFKIVRHETPEGTSVATTTTYTGVADHIDIDLTTTPGTITAKGHVTVDADSLAYQAHFTEEEFVFLVNDKMEPIGLKFSGSPGLTKAKVKGETH